MRLLSVSFLQWLAEIGVWTRPRFLTLTVNDEPAPDQIQDGFLYEEVRGGYAKWAYLRCPRCAETVTLSIAVGANWTVRTDWLSRPTVSPSIWQTGTCGAHFFIRKGELEWCRDERRHISHLV